MKLTHGVKFGTLYMLHVFAIHNCVIFTTNHPCVYLWHCQSRNISYFFIKSLSFGYIQGFNFLDFSVCKHCLYGKQPQTSHTNINFRRNELLELVHGNIYSPMSTISMDGAQYFVTY